MGPIRFVPRILTSFIRCPVVDMRFEGHDADGLRNEANLCAHGSADADQDRVLYDLDGYNHGKPGS